MSDKESPRDRVLREFDFVNAKRVDNSLAVAEERYPEGAPDHVIATLLCITVEEVEQEGLAITEKLRRLMKV
jgi:hypothetical protein